MLPLDELKEIKKQLLELCRLFVDKRIITAQDAIKAAQQSANEDSKSSMGDKYETGRAMAQLEIEKNTIQLAEAYKLKQQLESIPKESMDPKVRNGSLIMTTNGNYFLSISAGKFQMKEIEFFAISPSSPLGNVLMGLEKGNELMFNGKIFQITTIL